MKCALPTILFASLISATAFANQPLRSSVAKNETCRAIAGELEGRLAISSEACLAEAAMTLKDSRSSTINDTSVVTVLMVEAKLRDMTFEVMLKRQIGVKDDGSLSVSQSWHAAKIGTTALGITAQILAANPWSRSPLVRGVRNMSAVPESVQDWSNYGEAPDYDLLSRKTFRILDASNSQRTIGWIVTEDACSTESEMCYLSLARFSLMGELVGEIEEESRGIDE